MEHFDDNINNLKMLDFEDPQKWSEFVSTLYPFCKTSNRLLVNIKVQDINSNTIQNILSKKYNKNTVFEIRNCVYYADADHMASDQSIFNTCHLDNVIYFVYQLNKHGYFNIVLQDGMSINKVIDANQRLQEWADSINNATFCDKPLSPLEKYLLAYKYVTRFIYNDSDNKTASTRVSHILNNNGNYIICLGYAALLSELCKKVGIPCAIQYLDDSTTKIPRHANAMVYLKDEKYHINGAYISDPCFDSRQPTRNARHIHGMLKLNDAEKIYNNLNMSMVNPESTFNVLTVLPKYISDLEINLPKHEKEEVEDISITKKDFYMLTNNSYDIKEVLLADMVANHIIHPELSADQLGNLTMSEFTDDGGKVPY